MWFSSCLLLVVVTLEHYISWKCKAIGNNLGTQFSALTWALTLQRLQHNIGPPKNIPFCVISRSWSEKRTLFCTFQGPCMEPEIPPFLRVFRNEHESNFSYKFSDRDWDTFKQDNDSTVGGGGGCRVGEVRAGTTSPMPDHTGFKLQWIGLMSHLSLA